MSRAKIEHRAGAAAVLQADAPGGGYAVVFEDDGETGYLYGLNLTGAGPADNLIVDALHLYNVSAMDHRQRAYTIEIHWAADRNRAGLFIGEVCQAVFDFDENRAVCRTGFPPARGDFSCTHEWDESLASGF